MDHPRKPDTSPDHLAEGETADPAAEIFLALGSNIEPEIHLPAAVRELARRFPLLRVSRVWETAPVGFPGSPPFLNAAVLVRSGIPPRELKFEHLRPIEAHLGRARRDDPNAPRTIDIDLVLYGERVLALPEAGIELPDPGILRHAHLALPLADLAPEFEHPADGRTLREIAEALGAGAKVRTRDDLGPLDPAAG